MKLKTTVTHTTRTEKVVQLPADEIRRLAGAPPNAEVIVRVPGGGDWSNENLEIEEVLVRWTETKVTEEA